MSNSLLQELRQRVEEREAEVAGLKETLLAWVAFGSRMQTVRLAPELLGSTNWASFDTMMKATLEALATNAGKGMLDERDKYKRRKDEAYEERNCVVAALASLFPSCVTSTAIEGWDAEWHGCVYIELPTGQVSWHFHDSQAHLFAHLPHGNVQWDGHDTAEKYRRLMKFAMCARVDELTALRTRVANHTAQIAYMCAEIALALGIAADTPAGTVESVRQAALMLAERDVLRTRVAELEGKNG